MSYAAKIIEKFGGTRALATALSVPPTTVQSWKDSGLIPAGRQQAVLDKARELNLGISPADFFADPEGTQAANNSDKRASAA